MKNRFALKLGNVPQVNVHFMVESRKDLCEGDIPRTKNLINGFALSMLPDNQLTRLSHLFGHHICTLENCFHVMRGQVRIAMKLQQEAFC